MRSMTVGKNDAGQRLDRFLSKAVPSLPASLLHKYIRLKRVKVNGKGAKGDARLNEGDLLALYINDEFFEKPTEENAYLRIENPDIAIVYEDENLILADKRPGMVVHPDEEERLNTLITHIQAYLYQKRQWRPREENAFTPALCNRIDRNTGGIVICAKNAETLRIMNEKIRGRELSKYYLCLVHGKMSPPDGQLEGFIFKDEIKKQVYVTQRPQPGAKTAITLYRTLKTDGKLSLLECALVTGRTHQIRAMLAFAGHPLLGDGKYGSQALDKPYGRKYQALYSYRLRFDFTTNAGILDYLNGKEFCVENVDFAQGYFQHIC